jgi:CheY-like chemotaxis protein
MAKKKTRRKPKQEEPKRLVVLVADTNAENAQRIADVLTRDGFTVLCAVNMVDILLAITRDKPDVIFIDFVMMEGIKEGIETALRQTNRPTIPVILTGTSETCSHLNGRGWRILARLSDNGMTQSNVVYWAKLAVRREW